MKESLPVLPWSRPKSEKEKSRRRHLAILLVLGLLLLLLVLGAVLLLPGEGGEEVAPIPLAFERSPEEVSEMALAVDLIRSVALARTDASGQPTPDSAAMPADAAVVDGRVFVLDTNKGRILEVTSNDELVPILEGDSGPFLMGAMAMTEHQGKLYVAASLAGDIVVVDPISGLVERVIRPQVPQGAKALRPIGIAVTPQGDIWLSDPDNHRVLHLDSDGGFLGMIGEGVRSSGPYGLNTPGGLALDQQGNLYVVDMLNGRVKVYDSQGNFIMTVGEPGDTEGTFSRPKAIAVDRKGNIYVSDGLLSAIQVFGPDATYIGFIGRQDPSDKQSGSWFEAPHGLKIVGDELYVVDRFNGLFVFRVDEVKVSATPMPAEVNPVAEP